MPLKCTASVDTGYGANELHPMDQPVMTTSTVVFDTVDTGLGDNELYPMDQGVKTTDSVTFASINTGFGDNELYAMDQDVTTARNLWKQLLDNNTVQPTIRWNIRYIPPEFEPTQQQDLRLDTANDLYKPLLEKIQAHNHAAPYRSYHWFDEDVLNTLKCLLCGHTDDDTRLTSRSFWTTCNTWKLIKQPLHAGYRQNNSAHAPAPQQA